MPRSAPPAHGRVVAAVATSVLLHALAGSVWWACQERSAPAAPAVATRVDGPADDETTFVLRDPPAPRPRALPATVTEPSRPTEAVVPAVAVGSAAKPPHGGALPQPGTSPGGADSLPKSGGAKSLHGPLPPGQSIVYVLDCSSSMAADGLLESAVAAIKASLATLGPDVRFQVVAYDGAARAHSSELLPATPANVRKVGLWLDQQRPVGGSKHEVGVREGLWLQPGAVVLLTDADDLGEEEARRIGKLIRRPVRLSAVVFGHRRSTATSPLERLVGEHGGTVEYIGRE